MKMYCSKCGKQINDDAVFCMGCGERVANTSVEMKIDRENAGKSQSEANTAKGVKVKGSKPAIAWIIAAVASVIAIVAVIMCVLNLSSPKESNSVPKTADSVFVPKTRVTVYTDKSTGQENTAIMTYVNDGFVKLDDEIIQYNTHYEEEGNEVLESYFFTSSGKYLGSRTYRVEDSADYTTDYSTTDYIDLAYATTVDEYVRHHQNVKKVDGNTVYFFGGSYTELTVEDGFVYGEDTYSSNGEPVFRFRDYRLSNSGNKSEVIIFGGSDGFDIKIETTYEKVLVSFNTPTINQTEGNENDTQVNTNNAAIGFETEEELLKAFIACLNGEGDTKKFFDAFDPIGFYSFWLIESTWENSFSDAYDVFVNPDKGVDYLNKNYPDFIQGIDWNAPITSAQFDAMKKGFYPDNSDLKQRLREHLREAAEEYGSYDLQINNGKKSLTEWGYQKFSIRGDIPDSTGGIFGMELDYIERDGKYFWIATSSFAQSAGG